jgi:hypothetical protein
MVASVQKDAKRRLETVGRGGVSVSQTERPGSFIFKLQAAFLWLFKLRLLRTLVFVLQWQSEEAAAGALKVQVAVRS